MLKPLPVLPVLLIACTSGSASDGDFRGSIDTLPDGVVHVTNPAEGLWTPETRWRLSVDWRLGALDAEGPEQFGRIRALAVDQLDRVYVLDGMAQEIRVFDRDGAHVRTFAREGGGPGELKSGMTMMFTPEGHLRVLDPQNNRISTFDTAGTYLQGDLMQGSFFTSRFPGGYDSLGNFLQYLPMVRSEAFRFALVRYDPAGAVIDTIEPPRYEAETFDYTSPDGNNRMRTGVPFAPRLRWWFDRRGSIWSVVPDRYRLLQQTLSGDTLRIVDFPGETVPVTGADREAALEDIAWFVEEGGKIDPSRIPDTKPAVSDFFVDHAGYVWVLPFTARERQDRVVDLFDADGRYLGRLELPAPIELSPHPVVAADAVYYVTQDEFEVPYVLRVAITRP